jgi:hypothetical protein
MTKTLDEIVKEVYDEPSMKSLAKDMTDEDKKMMDERLRAFVSAFVLPIVTSIEAVATSPEASEELKRQLGRLPKDVVKPGS